MPRSSAGCPASARVRSRRRLVRYVAGLAGLTVVAPLVGVAFALPASPAPAGAAAHGPFSVLLPQVPELIRLPVVRAKPQLPASTIALIERPATLRATPGGNPVAVLGSYTDFGSRRIVPVVARRSGWLGVLATELPNGMRGWIPAKSAALVSDPYSIHVDVRRRLLRVFRYGRIVRRIDAGVGSSDTPTPTGRFAVTDKLTTSGPSPYGCCVLALNGHQPRVAPSWRGGNRLAIHGTLDPGTIGSAASLGCLHVGDADARWLLGHILVGTLVTIR